MSEPEKPQEEEGKINKPVKNKMFFIFGALLGLCVICIGTLSVVLVKVTSSSSHKKEAQHPKEKEDKDAKSSLSESKEASPDSQGAEHSENQPALKDTLMFIPVEPAVTISLAVGNRIKTVQVKMQIMTKKQKAAEILKIKMPILQNKLMLLIASKSYDELITSEGKVALSVEGLKALRDALKNEIETKDLEDLLINSFLIQ